MDGERSRKNREMFPVAAETFDAFTAAFGPGVKLIYIEENGQVLGRKFEDRVRDKTTQEDAA